MSITVVTITSNNPEDLRLTMKHMDSQSMPPYEHLVIDRSNDGCTKQLLETEKQPSYRKWSFEPGTGISEAYNKGIQKAEGDIIHLLDAGDYYHDKNVIREVANAFWSDHKAMWLHGQHAVSRGNMWMTSGKPFEMKKLYRGMASPAYSTIFLHKEMYDKHGLFRPDKKVAMDYDLLLRITDEPFIFLSRPIVNSKARSRKTGAAIKDMMASYREYKGFSLKAWLWGWRMRVLHIFRP